jgi:RluA family pseudouridine synthase
VWEDDDLVAVNKPAGVLSQGGEGGAGQNLVDLARAHYGLASMGVLHRLDRNVSGVVLIAKTPRAARGFSMALERGEIKKRYEAVVRGAPERDAFRIDAWLRKNERTNEVEARAARDSADAARLVREGFRDALTEVGVLERFRAPMGACARLEVRPITGRSHQIRAHLAHVGLPIVGDPKYGVAARGIARPLLHARTLEFRHPVRGDSVRVDAPVPWTTESLRRLARA